MYENQACLLFLAQSYLVMPKGPGSDPIETTEDVAAACCGLCGAWILLCTGYSSCNFCIRRLLASFVAGLGGE